MPSVLALVSKKVFDADARQQGRAVGVGDVWPTDRYRSTNKRLAPLSDGGALFLVTVRPPDERLWLVGVLERPVFDGAGWSADANTVAVRDVSEVASTLRFTNGKGLNLEPGKLGMSLQTPRELTAEDEALLRGTAVSNTPDGDVPQTEPSGNSDPADPADPVETARALAAEELDAATLSSLDGSAAEAERAPARAAKAFKAAAKSLGKNATALAVLSWGAEVLREVGNLKNGTSLFNAARTLERKLELEVDRTVQLALFGRFVDALMVEESQLRRLVKDVARSRDCAVVEPLLALCVRWAERLDQVFASDDPPYDQSFDDQMGVLTEALVKELEKLEEATGMSVVAELLPRMLTGARGIDSAVLERHRDLAVAAIHADPALRDVVAERFPAVTDSGTGWRGLLRAAGVLDDVAARGPDASVAWLARLLNWALPREGDLAAWIADALEDTPLGKVAPDATRPLRLDGLRYDIGVAVVDALLEHGVPLEAAEDTTFDMRIWSRREDRRPLEHIARHPRWSKRLAPSYDRWNHLGGDAVMRKAAMESAAGGVIFDAKVARVAELLDGATVARLDQELEGLRPFMTPDTIAALPALREVVEGLDVADMLARNLRGGVMDEWCWPAHDEASDALGSDPTPYQVDGPFPWFVMLHVPSRQVVVLGPTGEIDRRALPEGVPTSVRSMRYVDGDVFLFTIAGAARDSRWLSAPDETFRREIAVRYTKAVPTPKGALWEGAHLFERGAHKIPDRGCANPFTDGERFWCGDTEIDPDSGRRVGEGLPQWLRGDPDAEGELVLSACTYWPLPAEITDSPLGVAGGQAGIRVRAMPDDSHLLETIDGRTWRGRIPGFVPHALFTFPGRSEPCVALRRHGREQAIYLGDGSHPLLPARHGNLDIYWHGAPQWLHPDWWHYLVPRDLEGSSALASCTREQARRLLDAATAAEGDGTEVLTTDDGVTATLQRAARKERWTLTRLPRLAAAVDEVFPAMTAERLKGGIARIVERAAMLEGQVRQWQIAARTKSQVATGGLTDADVVGLGSVVGGGWRHTQRHFEASIRGADAFLNGEGTHEGDGSLRSWPIAGSRIPWQGLLVNLGAAVRQLLSPATPDETREQLSRALNIWVGTDFAANAEAYRLIGLTMTSPPPDTTHQSGDVGITASGARYALRTRAWAETYRFEAIERADAEGRFTDPDWARVDWTSAVRDGCWHGQAALRKALELAAAGETIPWQPAIAARISEATGLLSATAARLWVGAVGGAYSVQAELRRALGFKAAELDLAGVELPGDWHEIYEQSMPADPAALLAPLEDDGSGLSPVDRLIDVWKQRHGVRTPLDVDTVLRLERDLHTKTERFDLDVRVIEEPDAYAFLTADERFVVRPWRGFQSYRSYMQGYVPPGWPKLASQPPDDKRRPDADAAFTGWVLRHFLRLVSWGHLELPLGSPHRRGLARMCELIDARLANPDLLLLAGAVDLSEEPDPAKLEADFDALLARFDGEPYAACDGGVAAEGLDRGDLVVTWPSDVRNSLFFAFRPAKVRGGSQFAALARDLGFYDVFRRTGGGCSCGLNFGRHKVVDITDLPAWLVWQSEGFQRVVARLAAGAGEERSATERFESDPRVSAPEVVAEVAERLELSDDAATLYLQQLALAEPTDERVRRYNGWTDEQLAAATGELLAAGLVEEAEYAGTPRKTFVPGDIAFLPSPAPSMEASKLALYGLEPDERGRIRPPFGVVLPLRPLGELFADAWSARNPSPG